jgi:hypothetical protein
MQITNHFAILRNLRNISEAGVSAAHIAKINAALRHPSWAHGARRILPFRYVAAARAAPMFEPAIDVAMQAAIQALPALPGRTIVLVDVSISMDAKLSIKSDLRRVDAAAALAAIVNAEDLRVFSFSNHPVEVPARRGMAGVDAVIKSQHHSGTDLGAAVRHVNKLPHDRLIVVTDEQSQTRVPDPVAKRAYMVNVASNRHGIGYGRWTHIDGFSESVLRFIAEVERDVG